MTYKIEQIFCSEQKKIIVIEVLMTLPEWFGNNQANVKYSLDVMNLPFYCAFSQDKKVIGFICAKIHHKVTGDIFLLGIKPEYHRNGIGKQLVKKLEEYCVGIGCTSIVVKTLSEDSNYDPYKKTTEFYRSLEYKDLITFDEFWDEQNKCLLMIKEL